MRTQLHGNRPPGRSAKSVSPFRVMCGAAAPRLNRICGQSLVACHRISGARTNVKAVDGRRAGTLRVVHRVARLGSRDERGRDMPRGGRGLARNGTLTRRWLCLLEGRSKARGPGPPSLKGGWGVRRRKIRRRTGRPGVAEGSHSRLSRSCRPFSVSRYFCLLLRGLSIALTGELQNNREHAPRVDRREGRCPLTCGMTVVSSRSKQIV